MTTWHKVCALSDLKEGEPVGATVNGTPIGVYRIGDACHALHDVCPHEYALMSQGYQEGDTIECPLHAARFNIKTGAVIDGPVTEDLAVFQVKIEGDDVLVAPADKAVT